MERNNYNRGGNSGGNFRGGGGWNNRGRGFSDSSQTGGNGRGNGGGGYPRGGGNPQEQSGGRGSGGYHPRGGGSGNFPQQQYGNQQPEQFGRGGGGRSGGGGGGSNRGGYPRGGGGGRGQPSYPTPDYTRHQNVDRVPERNLVRSGQSVNSPSQTLTQRVSGYHSMEFCFLAEDKRCPKEQLGRDAARQLKDLSLLAPDNRKNEICRMGREGFETGRHGVEVIKNFEMEVGMAEDNRFPKETNSILPANDVGESSSTRLTPLSSKTVIAKEVDYYLKFQIRNIEDIPDFKTDIGLTITATVISVHNDEGWYYFACRTCSKKVERNDLSDRSEPFHCAKCGDVSEVYSTVRVVIRVQDATGSSSFVLFKRHITSLINCSADFLDEKITKDEGRQLFPDEFKTLVNRKFVFKIQVSSLNIINNHLAYTVHKLTDDENVMDVILKRSPNYEERKVDDDRSNILS